MSTRKNKLPPFVAVYRSILKDPLWRGLSSSAKIAYIYLRSKFHPKNPESDLGLSYGEMKDVMASATFSKSMKELQAAGFIKKTKQGGLYGGVCRYKCIGDHGSFYHKGFKV